MHPGIPLIMGIAGGSGSGKTSVTARILERLEHHRAAVILHDSYYRDIRDYGGMPPSEVNFDHPDALETSLLVRHLEDLRAGRAWKSPRMTMQRICAPRRRDAWRARKSSSWTVF